MESIDEHVEKSSLTDQDDVGTGSGVSSSGQNKNRKYRDSSGSKTFDLVKPLRNDMLDMVLPSIERDHQDCSEVPSPRHGRYEISRRTPGIIGL
ncbi:hypothetical protein Tco_1039843 [Tanacetum coccineum]